jgi:hypothetical protein
MSCPPQVSPSAPYAPAFTPLVQPASTVTQTPSSGSFDAGTAYLLGQCCALTYTQFSAGTLTEANFSTLDLQGSLAGYTAKASSPPTLFTISEANEPGPSVGDAGDYTLLPGGFAVQLTLSNGSNTKDWTVIALRGTRTFVEWLQDAEALPVPFGPTDLPPNPGGQGAVHAGFYGDYTVGTDGKTVKAHDALNGDVSKRADGSLAAQVGAFVKTLSADTQLYVTGHSLGAALATLCAMDIAVNFAGSHQSLVLYSLASPRVAVGLSDSVGVPIPILGNQMQFVSSFQAAVPNAYRIVHAADIIPILPPLSTVLGPMTVSCAHVTDAYQGSGALAEAEITGGAVTSFKVKEKGSGYDSTSPPPVTLSGGGGWGAAATASIGGLLDDDEVEAVNLLAGGGGMQYTSAPTVLIGQSGSGLCENVVRFCAQTGDVGDNHSCLTTYVPFLQALANNFP